MTKSDVTPGVLLSSPLHSQVLVLSAPVGAFAFCRVWLHDGATRDLHLRWRTLRY